MSLLGQCTETAVWGGVQRGCEETDAEEHTCDWLYVTHWACYREVVNNTPIPSTINSFFLTLSVSSPFFSLPLLGGVFLLGNRGRDSDSATAGECWELGQGSNWHIDPKRMNQVTYYEALSWHTNTHTHTNTEVHTDTHTHADLYWTSKSCSLQPLHSPFWKANTPH